MKTLILKTLVLFIVFSGSCLNLSAQSQRQLITIAKDLTKSDKVRISAIKRIENQKVLASLVRNDNDEIGVRYAALKRLNDQDIIANLVQDDENDFFYRYQLIEKLDSKRWQDLFKDIVRKDKNVWCRSEAVKMISDQFFLKEFAIKDENSTVRLEAVKKINDLIIITETAKNDTDPKVRQKAVEYLEDNDLLIEIALNDKSEFVRKEAIVKITDQLILSEIAKNDSSSHNRRHAVQNINDQNILFDVAKNNTADFVCSEAIKKITDQDLLGNLAKSIKSIDALSDIILKLDSEKWQDLLIDIALNNKNSWNRTKAVAKTKNQDVLLAIANNDKDPGVRNKAVEYLDFTHKKKLFSTISDIERYNEFREIIFDQLETEAFVEIREGMLKGSIKGQLISRENTEPMTNTTVLLAEIFKNNSWDKIVFLKNTLVGKTNANGYFHFKNIPIGEYTIAYSNTEEMNIFNYTSIEPEVFNAGMLKGNFKYGELIDGIQSLYSSTIGIELFFLIQDKKLLNFKITEGKCVEFEY